VACGKFPKGVTPLASRTQMLWLSYVS